MAVKKPKERSKTINYSPHFPYLIKVIFSKDYEASREYYVGNYRNTSVACTITYGDGRCLLLFGKDAPLMYIAHECCHAVFDLINHLGLSLKREDEDGNELFCYLCGSLVQEVVKFHKSIKGKL